MTSIVELDKQMSHIALDIKLLKDMTEQLNENLDEMREESRKINFQIFQLKQSIMQPPVKEIQEYYLEETLALLWQLHGLYSDVRLQELDTFLQTLDYCDIHCGDCIGVAASCLRCSMEHDLEICKKVWDNWLDYTQQYHIKTNLMTELLARHIAMADYLEEHRFYSPEMVWSLFENLSQKEKDLAKRQASIGLSQLKERIGYKRLT